MKYIKRFDEEAKEKSIEDWCKAFNIIDYGIVNGLVNANQKITIYKFKIEQLPIQFGIVNGDFYCAWNNLKSLKNCPTEIKDSFYCSYNKLISLEGGPVKVGYDYDCSSNKLETLKGSPKLINNRFICALNQLTSLQGGPEIVNGWYSCSCNDNLTSLEGSPKFLSEQLYCESTPIYEVYKLFPIYEKYIASLDLNYFRNNYTCIDKRRFEKALNEINRKAPEKIIGYKYI
jgi:hypothetical protein